MDKVKPRVQDRGKRLIAGGLKYMSIFKLVRKRDIHFCPLNKMKIKRNIFVNIVTRHLVSSSLKHLGSEKFNHVSTGSFTC